MVDEDADFRSSLATLGPAALRELEDVLTWPEPSREALLRSLVGSADAEPIAQLIAIADTRHDHTAATAASDLRGSGARGVIRASRRRLDLGSSSTRQVHGAVGVAEAVAAVDQPLPQSSWALP
jgi:hypothetical protein